MSDVKQTKINHTVVGEGFTLTEALKDAQSKVAILRKSSKGTINSTPVANSRQEIVACAKASVEVVKSDEKSPVVYDVIDQSGKIVASDLESVTKAKSAVKEIQRNASFNQDFQVVVRLLSPSVATIKSVAGVKGKYSWVWVETIEEKVEKPAQAEPVTA